MATSTLNTLLSIFSFILRATYSAIGQRVRDSKMKVDNVLDIGTATGHPLYSIIDTFADSEVLGIDIDKNYVPACQKLFKEKKNVQIEHMNFFDLEKEKPSLKFDVIIFGSSFMLMPDQQKALEIAKRKLNPNGKIYFLLTLYDNKNRFNNFMESVKPYLKYATTVDFGKVTYKSEFNQYLEDHELKVTHKARCSGNFWLKYFKFYVYEAEKSCWSLTDDLLIIIIWCIQIKSKFEHQPQGKSYYLPFLMILASILTSFMVARLSSFRRPIYAFNQATLKRNVHRNLTNVLISHLISM